MQYQIIRNNKMTSKYFLALNYDLKYLHTNNVSYIKCIVHHNQVNGQSLLPNHLMELYFNYRGTI